jgi:hypothetical protein
MGGQRYIAKDDETTFCETFNKHFYSVALDESTAQINMTI